jgi:hypothetical protein
MRLKNSLNKLLIVALSISNPSELNMASLLQHYGHEAKGLLFIFSYPALRGAGSSSLEPLAWNLECRLGFREVPSRTTNLYGRYCVLIFLY